MDAKSESLKEQGNECVKAGKYEEAILHYSHAIKIQPNDYKLYSNRSMAFLKIQQYYHALQDAYETIRLKPDWPKGYFRKGEVEFHTEHYETAYMSYKRAYSLDSEDKTLKEAIEKTSKELVKKMKAQQRLPWLGVGGGVLVGLLIVLGDLFLAKTPLLGKTFILQLCLVAVFAGIGLGLAHLQRWFVQSQRDSLLEPPLDFLDFAEKSNNAQNETDPKPHNLRKRGAQTGKRKYQKGKT
ncbi:heat shock protein STI1 [Lingula anatina]|uniref:Heat shock protein STI1 n=1 Tax=Lingula anatina TaxID=7574 RepID=A0A1S3JSM2_LINAN|nr:heat shock protein STI1 [Lingula anatina]|eukprot:XP_013413348.1 heat shock protein STI1 [Lingula anatina]